MEQFRIRVLELHRKGEIVTAKVRAISKRQIKGRPIASIHLQVRIESVPGEKSRVTSERAFNEALLFLDIL
jgi:hypothetical protein